MATKCAFEDCENITLAVVTSGEGDAVCNDCTPRILNGETPP
ncbi:hypothetical protein [Halostagnicola sp. A56]|nr:hypothetical protein [Halostagnicola sp. A56]